MENADKINELSKYEPKVEDWFFEHEQDEDMGIETIHYANGGISKRCKLRDGRLAVSHLLKGKDIAIVKRITGGDSSKFQSAVVALSTKINDKSIVIEDVDELWFNDASKINTMASAINFL